MSGLPTELIYLYGGSFVGNFLTAVCFGAITVQVWRYFEIFRRDGIWTRGIVLFLWVVEFFQLICVTQAMWYYLIAGYGDALRMLVATWTNSMLVSLPLANHHSNCIGLQFSVYQIGSVTSSATVQTFFAYRVYSLSNNIWFGAIVELFAVVQCGFGIAVSVSANRILDFATFVEEDTWLTLAWLAMQAAADLVICFAMVYLLKQRRTGFRKSVLIPFPDSPHGSLMSALFCSTDNILNVMTVWTINTGVATAIISLIILVAASGVRSEPGGAVVIDVIREQEIAYEDGYTHAYIPPHNPSYGSRAGNQRTQTVAFPTDGDY
ncbi:hypothetical protein DL93DRAFT_2097511 [Clavulina sp. PMI_390]|nr:hypothetical protein DL93DRAFT_2097511 [Clavulina sp. PMI_390]